MTIILSILVGYGWFLNLYYLFNPKVTTKGNAFIHLVGIFLPMLGAAYGYFCLFRNSINVNVVKN